MWFIYYFFGWIYGCFFFKQKTAYEMRISDWSSDVCSSDLCPAELDVLAEAEQQQEEHRQRQPDQAVLDRVDRQGLGQLEDEEADEGEQHEQQAVFGRAEIGRASCRERVCQYV